MVVAGAAARQSLKHLGRALAGGASGPRTEANSMRLASVAISVDRLQLGYSCIIFTDIFCSLSSSSLKAQSRCHRYPERLKMSESG